MTLMDILSGGFLRGKRTYILAAAMVIQALAQWAVGDMSLAELIQHLPEIVGGLGLATLRAGVANNGKET